MLAEAVLKKNDKQRIQMHCTRRHGAIMATACVVTSSDFRTFCSDFELAVEKEVA